MTSNVAARSYLPLSSMALDVAGEAKLQTVVRSEWRLRVEVKWGRHLPGLRSWAFHGTR